MPRLSIIIPCLGGGAEFDGTLVSVLQHRPADCEVLVVHTERYEDPYGLGGEVRFLLAEGRNLTALINAGLVQARGEVVHVLECGVSATEGWTDAAIIHFDDPQVASVSPVVLSARGESLLSAGIRWTLAGSRRVVRDSRLLQPGTARLRASILGPSLQAGFYRREVVAGLGGFHEHADGHADVDIALAIDALDFLQICEPGSRLIRVSDSIGAAPSALRSGQAAERLFWLHARSRGIALSLALHPLAVAAACRSPAAILGRIAAMLDMRASKRLQQRLKAAQAHLADLASVQATIRLPMKSPGLQPPAERRRAA